MGQKLGKGKLANKQLQRLTQLTQLRPDFIQQVYGAFIDRTGRGGRMNLNDFKVAYPQINPNWNYMTADADAERAFMMFDTDRNGILTFEEFLMGYIQIQRGLFY